MRKILLSIFVLMVALLAIGKVSAADYSIKQIDVDGTTVFLNGDQTEQVEVKRGETAVIEVWVKGNLPVDESVDNVRVEASIGGFENYDVEERTSTFKVEGNITYKKTLRLEIPFDVELGDDPKDFDLRVEAFDRSNHVPVFFDLRLSEMRHALNIQDVIFSPDLEITAGKTLFAKVRVENLGDRKEEDIKVTVSIPELGLSTRTYIDELVNKENNNNDDDEETSASTEDLFLRIPENVKSGVYDVRVSLEFNRGFNTLSKTYKLNVLGAVPTTLPEMTTVTVDSTSKEVMQGKGVVYKISIANLGTTARQYSLDVSGISDWGTFRVDPSSVIVQPTQTSEMFVFVTARETAQAGSNLFTVRVNSNGNVVKTLNLEADVKSAAPATSQFDNLKRGLEIGFIVLLIILVILGLILAITRMRKPEERREEMTSEGQTYY